MAKVKKQGEEEFDEDVNDFDEDDLPPEPQISPKPRPRPVARIPRGVRPVAPRAPIPAPAPVAQVRYQAFHNPEVKGIGDMESGEAVATSVYEALADIMERLERIENSIGSLMGGQ